MQRLLCYAKRWCIRWATRDELAEIIGRLISQVPSNVDFTQNRVCGFIFWLHSVVPRIFPSLLSSFLTGFIHLLFFPFCHCTYKSRHSMYQILLTTTYVLNQSIAGILSYKVLLITCKMTENCMCYSSWAGRRAWALNIKILACMHAIMLRVHIPADSNSFWPKKLLF